MINTPRNVDPNLSVGEDVLINRATIKMESCLYTLKEAHVVISNLILQQGVSPAIYGELQYILPDSNYCRKRYFSIPAKPARQTVSIPFSL